MKNSEFSGPRYWKSLDDLAETPAFTEWVEREFPDEIRPRTSMQDLRDIAAELDERLRQGQWNLPEPEPAQQRLFVLLTDARNGSTGDLDVAHVLREAGKEWGKNAEWIEPVAAKNKKPKKPKKPPPVALKQPLPGAPAHSTSCTSGGTCPSMCSSETGPANVQSTPARMSRHCE